MKRFLGFRNSRKIFTLVAFAAVTAFAVQANTDMKGQTKEVGGYKLELSFMANPVAVGKNQIMLKIEDSMMAAIEGAMVKTSSSMDRGMKMDSSAMSDQKPILLDLMKNPDASKKGEYMADISFPYEGKWMIETTVQVGADTLPATFEVQVAQAGPNMAVVGGFIGLIALVVIIAAINKARSGKGAQAKA